jgi:hypothetical protein
VVTYLQPDLDTAADSITAGPLIAPRIEQAERESGKPDFAVCHFGRKLF